MVLITAGAVLGTTGDAHPERKAPASKVAAIHWRRGTTAASCTINRMALVVGFLRKWGAAIVLMIAIFLLSSRPPSSLPEFGWADRLVKKTGHVVGYGALALSFRHALEGKRHTTALAWLLAVLYGITDEWHQSLVPGRHPSMLDVAVFDAAGAGLALWIRSLMTSRGKVA
jgi:VanZ family protein